MSITRRSILAALSGLPIIGALSVVASARTPTEPITDRHLSTAIINGEPVMFDINDIDLKEGDMAVGFDWYGNLVVQTVSLRNYDFEQDYRPGGIRLQYGPPHKNEHGHSCRSAFYVVGKVIT